MIRRPTHPIERVHPIEPVHPIEVESYQILGRRVDLSGLAHDDNVVAARIVHATAEPSLLDDLVFTPRASTLGMRALTDGAPILCDVEMVRAGISAPGARCYLGEAPEPGEFPTRSAAAMARALADHPEGAIVVVGCAPTALAEVVRQLRTGRVRPALVIGVPVGFVGAAEAKEDLLAASGETGVPAIVLRGERGGAAVGAAALNALWRHAEPRPTPSPALLLIGHGTRSSTGAAEVQQFAAAVAQARPEIASAAGYIEFLSPTLDEALDQLVDRGARSVVAVPLVLLGAGHLKDDGPAALTRARERHRATEFAYAREMGLHPDVLAVVGERIAEASAGFPNGTADAVVVVGRGSTDPDANADLAKAARLLADGRGYGQGLARTAGDLPTPPLGLVAPAFVSLAHPDVSTALAQCAQLGARTIAVVPYFLFDGLLIDRIAEQAAAWTAEHPNVQVMVGRQMGIDPRLVELVWARYAEAVGQPVQMNCDGCLYRAPLPGYEHRVGAAPFGAGSAPS